MLLPVVEIGPCFQRTFYYFSVTFGSKTPENSRIFSVLLSCWKSQDFNLRFDCDLLSFVIYIFSIHSQCDAHKTRKIPIASFSIVLVWRHSFNLGGKFRCGDGSDGDWAANRRQFNLELCANMFYKDWSVHKQPYWNRDFYFVWLAVFSLRCKR